MEMAYRERWVAEIAEMQRLLAGFEMREECKWGKPTYTVGGKNNRKGDAGDPRGQRLSGETVRKCDS